jgi:DNA polymerase III alpha subunit
VIRRLGQEEAFLSALQLSRFFRDNRITAKLIGAGPSSLWAFVHGLTEINPLRHGLPAERFLTTEQHRSVSFTIVVDEVRVQEVNDFIAEVPSMDEFFSIHTGTEHEQVPIRTVELIRLRRHREFCLERIPWSDHKTSAALRSGETSGLFQLDSKEIRCALQRVRSGGIEDIAALTAARGVDLVEPGILSDFLEGSSRPVRRSKTSPTIQPIVAETNGLALFQEQIMSLLHKFGGIPLATAYCFIKAAAMGRGVDSIRETFLKSAVGHTLSSEIAEEVIDDLQTAAVYATCKSHHMANAVTTWQAAYLKFHFRQEFDEVVENIAVGSHKKHHGEKTHCRFFSFAGVRTTENEERPTRSGQACPSECPNRSSPGSSQPDSKPGPVERQGHC